MKQAVQDLRGGGTRLVEVPIPAAGRGQVVVRTAFSLLSSGTERMVADFAGKNLADKARARPDLVRQTLDKARREGVLAALDAVRTRLAEPMALGYASSGTVVDVGAEITDLAPGDRVACAGGGFAVHAEYVAIPRLLLARLPDSVDFETGAFATLGAIALHGFRLAQVQVGERVGVIGLGLVGLLATAIGRSAGAEVFGVDLNPERVVLGQRMGGRCYGRAQAAAAILAATGGQGADAVLICADTPANDPVELAAEIARDRARLVAIGAVGLELPRKAYYEKELNFVVSRSYGPGRYDPAYEEGGHDYPAGYVRWTEGRNLQSFVDLMGRGQIDVAPLITHRIPLERAAEAYDLITGEGGAPPIAVLLDHRAGEEATAGRQPVEGPVLSGAEGPVLSGASGVVEGRLIRLAQGPSPAAPVRLGVLGAGRFAQGVVLPILKKRRGVACVGIASARGLNAAEAGRRFGFAYATTDEDRILQDAEINTLAILTRHNMHAQQTAAALRAGKNVWCEKPLALTAAGLSEVETALARASGILTVGFNRRFAPLARPLREFFGTEPGPLTMVYRVNAGALPPNHWLLDPEQGGGRTLGEVCHFVDFLTYLAAALPRRVTAQGSGGEDVVVVLEFPGGSVGTIVYAAHGDRSSSKERLEVFGSGKTAVLDDFRRLEMSVGGRRETRRLWLRSDKGHAAHWDAFLSAVASGGPAPIPYPQLLAVADATLAAVESIRRGAAIELDPAARLRGQEEPAGWTPRCAFRAKGRPRGGPTALRRRSDTPFGG
jgi:predicted dehydrogenase